MKSIWKYPLAVQDLQEVEAPSDFEPISAQMQNGVLCVWAMVTPSLPVERHQVWIVGTGRSFVATGLRFVATVQVGMGLVFHVLCSKVF